MHPLLQILRAFCILVLLCSTIIAAEAPRKTVLRRQGDDGVHTYRIPGLATTEKGTLIAVFDIRHNSANDLPGDIDVGMMRSTDDGETWSKMATILDFDRDEPGARGNGVGDPAVLVDRKTGMIFVIALWSYGDRAWNGSGPGLTKAETGQLVLTTSSDDGQTWSTPRNISDKMAGRDPKWRLCFNGPGSGIQTKDGTLVFAAQFRDAKGSPHSCLLYSQDHGEKWSISAPAIADRPATSEAQVAELPDGGLLLSMRDESRSGKRAWSKFDWKEDLNAGEWSPPWSVVADATCMASLVAHPEGALLFSNPPSATQRKALAIRSSRDGGKTWSDGKVVDTRPCGYSCMTVLKDGSIGVLYETGDKTYVETLTFARFPASWFGIK